MSDQLFLILVGQFFEVCEEGWVDSVNM